jgi:hypothetical protein
MCFPVLSSHQIVRWVDLIGKHVTKRLEVRLCFVRRAEIHSVAALAEQEHIVKQTEHLVARLVQHSGDGDPLLGSRAKCLNQLQGGCCVQSARRLIEKQDARLGSQLCVSETAGNGSDFSRRRVLLTMLSPIAMLTRLRCPPEMPLVVSSPILLSRMCDMPSTSITVSATFATWAFVKDGGSLMPAEKWQISSTCSKRQYLGQQLQQYRIPIRD